MNSVTDSRPADQGSTPETALRDKLQILVSSLEVWSDRLDELAEGSQQRRALNAMAVQMRRVVDVVTREGAGVGT